jgi:16S rRNA (cytosine1402-N4)-methyltransferase
MLKKMPTDESNLPLHSSADQLDYHIPVLLQETIDGLHVKADGIYVDCTFGGGGHSRALLAQLGEKGILVAFDQDEAARKNLPTDSRVIFVPQNFRHLQRFLRLNKITQVDGILADLGVSSHQFDKADRGFSIRFDAALDMRMDQRQKTTAADILKQFTELQLHKMLEQYGEVTNAKTLAKTIVQQRGLMPIKTIQQFKQAVESVVKGNPQKYFAQVFQALRIEVNDEMGALKELLQQTPSLLKSGGRIAIITFHSLEDRMVKNFFKTGSFSEELIDDLYGGKPASQFKILTKKPILPTDIETRRNKRSRSAKLRLVEKK